MPEYLGGGSGGSGGGGGSFTVENVVDDHGAVGDGITDDTASIQEAVDTAISAGGGIVYFPPGHFLTAPINIHADDAPVTILGAGMGATLVTLAGSSVDGGVFDFDEATVDAGAHDMCIRDIEIDGNKANQDGSGGHVGIRIVRVTRFLAKRVHVHHCDGYNIGLVGGAQLNRSDQTIEDAWLHNGNYDGLDIKSDDFNIGGNTVDRVTLVNVNSWDNGGGTDTNRGRQGIDVRGKDVVLKGCRAWGNETNQIVIRPFTFGVDLFGCQGDGVDGNNHVFSVQAPATLSQCRATKGDIGFAARADGVSFSDCKGYKNATIGAEANGVGDFSIIGGEYKNNGTGTSSGRGIQIANVGVAWKIIGATITDDDVGDQENGIYFTGTNVAGIITSNDAQGNAVAAQNADAPSGTEVAANLPAITVAA